MRPTLQIANSPSRTYRVTVIPTSLSCAPSEAGCSAAARAVIEHVSGTFTAAVGAIKLVNQEAPGQILISDDGERILTIDDYADVGFGPNVIVIYRRNGTVVRRMKLADFLPETYINGLPRTVSSLGWAGYHAIRAGTHKADIGIFLVDASHSFDRSRSLTLELDLDSGAITTPRGPAWDKAMLCARAMGWLVPKTGGLKQREQYARQCRLTK